jgi:hypothetical protein
MAAGHRDRSRENVTQIDANLAADVRWGDAVTRDIHSADIVRPCKIGRTSVTLATTDSAVRRNLRPGVRSWERDQCQRNQ